jgi:predicted NBD/HSP70 family sugar kinase
MERRFNPRIEKSLPVSLGFGSKGKVSELEAKTRDLSFGGLCALVDMPVSALVDKLNVKVVLSDKEIFESPAEVVRVTKNNDRITALGLKFNQTNPAHKNLIETHVRSDSAFVPLKSKLTLKQHLGLRLNDREKSSLDIFDTLRKKGPLSKTQISQMINLNMGTLSNYINSFIREGMILNKGLDVSSGGRPPELLEINPAYCFIMGIELAPKYVRGLITDFSGTAIVKKEINVNCAWENHYEEVEKFILSLADNQNVDCSKIVAIGIGVSNCAGNFSNLKNYLEKRFFAPVVIENSHAAALFGEFWTDGINQLPVKNILYFGMDNQISTLMGEDLFLNKGQLGIKLVADKKKELLGMGEDSFFYNLEINSNFEEEVSKNANNIASLINALNPSAIILGQGLEKFGHKIGELLKEIIDSLCFEEVAKNIKIFTSHLGADSVSLGVASLVLRDIFIQL